MLGIVLTVHDSSSRPIDITQEGTRNNIDNLECLDKDTNDC